MAVLVVLRALETSCPLQTGPLSDVEQALEHGKCFRDRQNMRPRSGLAWGAFHPLHLTHLVQIPHRHHLAGPACSNKALVDTKEATHAYLGVNIDRIRTSDACVYYFVRAPRTQTPLLRAHSAEESRVRFPVPARREAQSLAQNGYRETP